MVATRTARQVPTATASRRSGSSGLLWPIAVVLAFAIGVTAATGWNALTGGQLQPGPVIGGTISVVNHNGSAICLTPDGGGKEFCGTPFLQAGSAPLAVGQHVSGRTAQLNNGSFSGEVFIVTTPGPH